VKMYAHSGGPIRSALVDDYDVILAGDAHLFDRYQEQRSLHPSRCGGPTVPPHRGKASRSSFALSTAAFTVSDGRIGRRHW